MDYRTSILAQGVLIEDQLLEDIYGLYFGFISESRALFDYTRYIEENQLDPIDYKVFMRANKRYIELIAADHGLFPSQLFYLNTDGHILVASELVFICLMYIDPDMLRYFNTLLTDLTADGFALSKATALRLAEERIPSDILHNIIKEREKASKDNDQ